MDLVFLVYGLAFLAMGLVIVIRYEYDSRLRLGDFLWLLAAFGFIHGLREWMDLWRVVRGDTLGLASARPVVLLASFVFLLEFGRRLLRTALSPNGRAQWCRRLLEPWLHVAVLAAILAGTLAGTQVDTSWQLALDVWSRLLCGLPGAVMAGLGMILYYHRGVLPALVGPDIRSVRLANHVAGASFLAYAVVGGLIGPKTGWLPASVLNQDAVLAVVGIPIQLLRATCAVSAAVSVGLLLRVFHLESMRRLQDALVTAEQSLIVVNHLVLQNDSILDSVSEGIVGVDCEGLTVFVNDAAIRLLGYERDELIGRNIHGLTHDTRRDGSACPEPDDCPIDRTVRDHLVRRIDDDRFWRKDGSGFAVEYTVSPLITSTGANGAVLAFHDISEHRRAEAEISRLSGFQQDVLKAVGNAIVVMDVDGLVTLFNAAAEALTGYPAAEVMGRLRLNAGTSGDGATVLQLVAGGPPCDAIGWVATGEWSFRHKLGGEVPVLATLSPLADACGSRTGWILAAQDISHIKLLEDGLRRSNAELERFTMVLAHHLQEPVRLQYMFAQRLARAMPTALGDDAHEFLGYIMTNASRLRRLITDVQSYLAQGQAARTVRPCNASTALADAAARLHEELVGVGAVMERTLLPTLAMDCADLANVFYMLLENAITYRHAERPLRITVSAEVTGAKAVVSIADNGIGIEPQFRERVFQVFERLHADSYLGTGIGLAMVKKCVEAAAGRVWIDDGIDGGICVRVALATAPGAQR